MAELIKFAGPPIKIPAEKSKYFVVSYLSFKINAP